MKIEQWSVATWKRGNIGGTDLVLCVSYPEKGDATVTFATGPTPWGSGSWGPFPVSVVSEARPLRAADSWRVSGSYESRWAARDLLLAMKSTSAAVMWGPSPAAQALERAIEQAERAAAA